MLQAVGVKTENIWEVKLMALVTDTERDDRRLPGMFTEEVNR